MTTATQIPTAEVRPAEPGDIAAIERLLAASDLPTAGVAESLRSFFVADHDGTLVGVVGVEACCNEYALLRSTAVEPSWRGRGLGRRLVQRAIAEAEAQGFKALYLLTTSAERYFPSFGFAGTARDDVPPPVRESVEFRSACPASATVMALDLARRA